MAGPAEHDNHRTLRLFLGYRLFLALLMALVFFVIQRGPLGSFDHDLFAVVLGGYLAITLISLLLGQSRQTPWGPQAILAVLIDTLCISVLVYASGGVQSGLGIMIALSIALGSLVISGPTALLLAALASLAVIGIEGYAHWMGSFAKTAYMQAGLLGIAFFALAILTQQLTRRARRSELLADQRGQDLAGLAELNEYVIQQMHAGIVVVDAQQVVQVMNEAAWVLLGMPNAMRHYPLEQASPALAREYEAWLANPQQSRGTFRGGGGGRELRPDFTPLGEHGEQGTLIVLEDTSTVIAQAQQLKLASLGSLTAGIAHEIRNPLGAISHAAQLLSESPALAATDRRMSDIIQHNSQRVNEVIQNVLKLSRQDLPKPKPLKLSPWLEQQAAEISHMLGLRSEQIHVEIEPPGTTVFADAGQLRQVLEVLCDNALSHFDLAAEKLQLKLLAGITPESGGPFIEVHDNGKGIDSDTARQLFEPFFTTRHQGTGLGLYIARQLSEANRTRLDYQPLPGGGSCFRLSFPNPKRPKYA